jgi:hypothetical protein
VDVRARSRSSVAVHVPVLVPPLSTKSLFLTQPSPRLLAAWRRGAPPTADIFERTFVTAKTSIDQSHTPLYQTKTTFTFGETSFDQSRTPFFFGRMPFRFHEASADETTTTHLFDETSANETKTTFTLDETSADQTKTPVVLVRTPFCFDETSFNKTTTTFLFDETSVYETLTAGNKTNSSNDSTESCLSLRERLFTEQERPSCSSARRPTNLPRPITVFMGPSSTSPVPSSTSPVKSVHQKGAQLPSQLVSSYRRARDIGSRDPNRIEMAHPDSRPVAQPGRPRAQLIYVRGTWGIGKVPAQNARGLVGIRPWQHHDSPPHPSWCVHRSDAARFAR